MQKAKSREILKVLITAGPTRAYLDQVRFISNFSTGELGFLTAKILAEKDVQVFAVVGPTIHPFEKLKLKKLIRVETNEQMEHAVFDVIKKDQPSWGIFSAAVLDFKPRRVSLRKVSSGKGSWRIDLAPTHKIIDRVSCTFPHLKKVGFKLEAKTLRGSALKKFGALTLKQKKYNRLVLNFLSDIESNKKHRAYLFNEAAQILKVASSKPEIARWIAAQVSFH